MTAAATPDFTAHRHPVLAVACPDCKVRVGAWCNRPSGHAAMDLHKARLVEADRVWELHKLPAITQVGPETYVYDKEQPMTQGDCDIAIPEFLQAKLNRSPERLAREAKACAKRRRQIADPPGRHIKMPSKRSIAAAKALSVPVGFLRSAGAQTGTNEEAIMKTKSTKKKAAGARKGPTGKTVSTGKSPPARKGGGESKTAQLEAMLANPTTLKAVCAKFGWLEHSARAAISTLPGKIAKARPGVKAEVLKAKNAGGDTTYQLALKGSAKAAA